MAEFSVVVSGDLLCNALCTYCSATGIDKSDYNCKSKDKVAFGKTKWDEEALYKLMSNNPIIKESIEKQQILTLNFWGSEPLLWIKDCDRLTKFVDERFPNLKYQLFISTNGLLLGAKHVQEWIYKEYKKHHLQLQISHDGLGQYIRTKDIDPLYDPRMKDFIVKMAKDGILSLINATLNNFNCSPIGNMLYFNKWIWDNGLQNCDINIKLNHNNDSEYTGPYRLKGENLRRYMHEMEILWQQTCIADKNDLWWKPFTGYFENQMTRWQPFSGYGGCAQYSLGIRDFSWCCNTMGEYVFCQLCSDTNTNPNPDVVQSEECRDCEYRFYDDCHPCPDMIMSEECEYKKEYIRLVLRMKQFRSIMQSIINENNCNCNGGNRC